MTTTSTRHIPPVDMQRPVTRRVLPRRFLVAGAILLLVVAYLAFTGLGSATAYYMTVSELESKGVESGQVVRVSGDVVPGSIQRSGSTVRFTMADSGGSLPVLYDGVVPDIFGPNIQVVVEGRPDQSGTFQASTLLAKCPSKFEDAESSNPSGNSAGGMAR